MDLATAEAPPKLGRPTKFTPDVVDKLLRAIASGNRITTACKLAGISPQLLSEWRAAAERGEPAFVAFMEDVHAAEAESERTLVASLTTAGDRDWHAHAWLLARRHGWVDESKRPQAGSTSNTTVNIAVLSMDMLPGIAGLLGAPGPGTVVDTTSSDVEDIPQREDM